jgi:hypothetical protein
MLETKSLPLDMMIRFKFKKEIHDACLNFSTNHSFIYYRYLEEWKNPAFLENFTEAELLQALADEPCYTYSEFGTRLTIALAARQPSPFFIRCKENGNLKIFFPELFATVGCIQNPVFHKHDVFNHTMIALDATEHDDIKTFDFDTKLAILCHDLGKPYTRKEINIE